MASNHDTPIRIGIIGAGFSGTAMAANLARFAETPIEIILFERRGVFAKGEAYSTPYAFHLLNVRAHDMSLFDDDPSHFVEWLKQQQNEQASSEHAALEHQFVPREWYGRYLSDVLEGIQQANSGNVTLMLESVEVRDAIPEGDRTLLVTDDNRIFSVDKVVLATGNQAPARFPFPISSDVGCVSNPWEFSAIANIPKHDAVVIVGTGLSMIDSLLTLYHQQHAGPIVAVSRHGMLPLPHAEQKPPQIPLPQPMQGGLGALMKSIRAMSDEHVREGGDWRSIVQSLRAHIPTLWSRWGLTDKRRFLRHVLPYWNIHRHCVPVSVAAIIEQWVASGQLQLFAGRILSVEHSQASIVLRGTEEQRKVPVQWLVNCMGPSLSASSHADSLLQGLLTRGMAMLDSLKLGYATGTHGALIEKSGEHSKRIFSVGPPTKGASWECNAVPEIRHYCAKTAKWMLELISNETQ